MVALKFDQGKAPLGLIPRSALIAEAQVLAFGAQKYARDNWRSGMDWSRLIDAALRHLTAFNDGEDTDPETGISHLAHARCCLGFLIEYQEKGHGTDDRHTSSDPIPAPVTPKRGCTTCRYGDLYITEEPCAGCFSDNAFQHWSPEE